LTVSRADPSVYEDEVVRAIVMSVHIAAGGGALIAGYVALATTKGNRAHRLAGRVFVAAMAATATLAITLSIMEPGEQFRQLIGALVLYLVSTGWSTVRRREPASRVLDVLVLASALALLVPFAVLTVELAIGAPPFLRSALPFDASDAVAVYGFTLVLVLAAVGDLRVVWRGPLDGRARLMRHIWRMCVALTLATASAFTNGFARLLPGAYHVPPILHAPKLVPLTCMIYFLVTGSRARARAPRPRD
jgi:uncharacterized membrane protein